MMEEVAEAEIEPVPAPKDMYSSSISGAKMKIRKLKTPKKISTKVKVGRRSSFKSHTKKRV